MRQHQRHRLRMLVLQKLRQLLRIHLLQSGHVPIRALAYSLYLCQQRLGLHWAKSLRQNPQRILRTAANHVLLRLEQSIELSQHLRQLVRWNLTQPRNLFRHPLNIAVRETLKQSLRQLIPERHHQDRCLPQPGNIRRSKPSLFRKHQRSTLRLSAHRLCRSRHQSISSSDPIHASSSRVLCTGSRRMCSATCSKIPCCCICSFVRVRTGNVIGLAIAPANGSTGVICSSTTSPNVPALAPAGNSGGSFNVATTCRVIGRRTNSTSSTPHKPITAVFAKLGCVRASVRACSITCSITGGFTSGAF